MEKACITPEGARRQQASAAKEAGRRRFAPGGKEVREKSANLRLRYFLVKAFLPSPFRAKTVKNEGLHRSSENLRFR